MPKTPVITHVSLWPDVKKKKCELNTVSLVVGIY